MTGKKRQRKHQEESDELNFHFEESLCAAQSVNAKQSAHCYSSIWEKESQPTSIISSFSLSSPDHDPNQKGYVED